MFSTEMVFYHGTTDSAWESIQKDNRFFPNNNKDDGEFWTAKGVYFACNNPYVALWYAHFKCYISGDKERKPVVIKFIHAIPSETKIVNLLETEGARLLLKMHTDLKEIHRVTKKAVTINTNLDALALKHLPDALDTEDICIFSAFQEGSSFQQIIHGHDFRNKYISERVGFCVGDNVSVCFLENILLSKLGKYEILTSEQLLQLDNDYDLQIFPIICEGLNKKLLAGDFSSNKKSKNLCRYFEGVCHG